MIPTKRIVIFNCPPRSGKDTIADLICNNYLNTEKRSFKDKLFEIALLVSNVSKEEWFERYKSLKEIPWDKLGGLSQREYLIKISEDWIKPTHGENYFGVSLAKSIIDDGMYIIPDGGFDSEISPVVESFTEESVLILQWGRNDCTFKNDSRDYIQSYPQITIQLPDNNGTIREMYNLVVNDIKKYFKMENI